MAGDGVRFRRWIVFGFGDWTVVGGRRGSKIPHVIIRCPSSSCVYRSSSISSLYLSLLLLCSKFFLQGGEFQANSGQELVSSDRLCGRRQYEISWCDRISSRKSSLVPAVLANGWHGRSSSRTRSTQLVQAIISRKIINSWQLYVVKQEKHLSEQPSPTNSSVALQQTKIPPVSQSCLQPRL